MKINRVYRNTARPASRSRRADSALPPAHALEDLTRRLLAEQLADVNETVLREHLQRAAAESASLAWTTPFPLLALPELLAEKGREARCRYERQRLIQNPNRVAFSLSA